MAFRTMVVVSALGVACGGTACTGSDPVISDPALDGGASDGSTTTGDGSDLDGGSDAEPEAGGDPLACDVNKPFTVFTNIAELSSPNEEVTLSMSADEHEVVLISYYDGNLLYRSASRATNPGKFGTLRDETINWGNGSPRQSALSRNGLSLYVTTEAGGAPFKFTRSDPSAAFKTGSTVAIPPEMPQNVALPVGTFATAQGTLLVTGTNQSSGGNERSIWEWVGDGTSGKIVLTSPGATVALTEPVVSKDGLTLFYAHADSNGGGKREIWKTSRSGAGDVFSALGAAVADFSGNDDAAPHFLSDDGCRLYFSTNNRAGGKGGRDFWLASRGK